MKRRARAFLSVVVLLGGTPVVSSDEPEPTPPPLGAIVLEGGPPDVRPRFALVLSGGGARGAAHIGVLKVLEELHVVPDLVVGTSMGSIVGGLYASGWSPERIEKFLQEVDWFKVFDDRVARDDESFRRKQDDTIYLVQAKLRFKGLRPYMPPGILGGQRLELLLKSLEQQSTAERDFDELTIPYRAVAADIVTGEAVVIGEGSLATAMRASMSVSGVFSPVVLDGRKLVDGGAVANLPVRIAQTLGAERILAVDISSPLSELEEIGSFMSILNQMSGLLTVGNVQADVQRLGPRDVYLRPELGDIAFSDFKRAEEAVAIGEAAARARLDDLRRFATSQERWSSFLARRAAKAPSARVVDEVRLTNESWVSDEVIRRRLEIETGKVIGETAYGDAIMKLRALDYFGTIDVEFEEVDGRGILHLDVPKKPYGRNLMQFGLSLHTDWENGRRSDSGFEFTARHQLLAANRLGGEWENTLMAGTHGSLVSRFYQPLDPGMLWFADVSLEIASPNPTIWVGGEPVAKYSLKSRGARVELGRVFEHWGDLRVGPYWIQSKGEVNIGNPVLPSFSERDAGLRALFRVDTRDTTAFPRRGLNAAVSYEESSRSMGSDGDVRQAFVSAQQSITRGRHTVTFGLEAMKNYETVRTYQRLYKLGGEFRLSGLGTGEVLGDSGGLARAMYYSGITNVELGPLSVRLFAGLTLECGQAYAPGEPVTWDSLRSGGSIFLGAETPLGPSFFGWGYTEGGHERLYIAIGQQF